MRVMKSTTGSNVIEFALLAGFAVFVMSVVVPSVTKPLSAVFRRVSYTLAMEGCKPLPGHTTCK